MGLVEKEDLLPSNIIPLDLLKFYFELQGKGNQNIFEMISILGIHGSIDEFMLGEGNTKNQLLMKKLNVAIEILNEPLILFVQNPFDQLNYSEQMALLKLFLKLKSKGITIVCSMQNYHDEIMQYFDKMIFLYEQRILFDGTLGQFQ